MSRLCTACKQAPQTAEAEQCSGWPGQQLEHQVANQGLSTNALKKPSSFSPVRSASHLPLAQTSKPSYPPNASFSPFLLPFSLHTHTYTLPPRRHLLLTRSTAWPCSRGPLLAYLTLPRYTNHPQACHSTHFFNDTIHTFLAPSEGTDTPPALSSVAPAHLGGYGCLCHSPW